MTLTEEMNYAGDLEPTRMNCHASAETTPSMRSATTGRPLVISSSCTIRTVVLQPRSPRRAFTLVDVLAACAMLSILMSMIIPLLSRTAALSEATERREEALLIVSNLLERCHLLPQQNVESIEPIAVELTKGSRLSATQWRLDSTIDPEVPMSRVTATLSWEDRPGLRREVTLVRWFPGGQP